MISNSDLQFLQPKNYLLSPGIETGRQGWGLFNTTLTSKIPTGAITAGAASITTFGASSTTPLSGDYSLRVASSGAITAGHGFISDAFTIDRQDKAKVMGWSFSFEAVSGTMNFSGTNNNTWAVYIYDVDGAAWIQPAGVYNLTQSSGVGIASGTFQTTATGTQYRIAVICITATGGAVEMRLDAFAVGPQKVLQGPSGPVGEIIATGSVTPPQGFLYCNGQSVSVSQYQDLFNSIGYTYGGAGASFNVPDLRGVFLRGAGSQTIGAETYTGTLGVKQNDATATNGVSASTSGTDGAHTHRVWTVGPTTDRLNWNSNAAVPNLAGWSLNTGGSANIGDYNIYASEVPEAPYQPNHGHAVTVSSTDTETRPANVAVAYHIRYLATYQMSQDTDTRVVAAAMSGSQSLAQNGVYFSNFSAELDTHGSVQATKYVIPVSGVYSLSAVVQVDSQVNGGGIFFASIYKNAIAVVADRFDVSSAAIASGSGQPITFTPSSIAQCVAGDEIKVYVYQQSGGSRTVGARLSVHRLSGPATIAASETVAASFGSSAGGSVADTIFTYIDFPTAAINTHNAVLGAGSGNSATYTNTWRFIAPISGIYSVSANLTFVQAAGISTAFDFFSIVAKNGSSVLYGQRIFLPSTSPGTPYGSNVSGLLRLNAGDAISIIGYQDNPGNTSRNLESNSAANYVSIVRVGN
jgi:microcystin-dependent protein